MDAKYNVTGKDRKDLVEAIENIAGMKAVYKKAPTFEYVVNNFIIDKEGTVTCKDEAALESLVESLIPAGYTPEGYEGTIALSIEIPFDKVDVGNLTKLLDAKGNLIKKALGIDDIRIEMQEDRVTFPWFTAADADSAKTYTDFIAALCRMSKEAKRVIATEKEVENEKYAFRCFLLRLGFIGDEFKTDRKILLKNLTGSSAFKDGGASHEITE